MAYYGSETYDYERPGQRRSRYSQFNLSPEARYRGDGLYRTRSQGHSPAPQINIYNDQVQDHYQRNESPYRYPLPPGPVPMQHPGVIPVPYPVTDYRRRSPSSNGSSRGRRKSRLGDDLVEEMAEIALRDRLRSRSRGRSDASLMERSDYYQLRLEEREKQLQDREQRQRWEDTAELKRIREEKEKKEDEERLIADYEEKRRKDAEKAKAEEIRIKEKIEREKREAEEKEKREYEEFLLKQKKKEEEKKQKEKEEKEKLEQEMKRRLINAGYTDAQIEFILDEERQKKLKERSRTRTDTAIVLKNRGPTYAKVHKDYLSVDTLLYYDIPYEVDKKDKNYIIVLREMDKYETEVLFEHTRRLRAGKLLIEPAKGKDKQFALFRKRDRSTSRVRKIGILEVKK